MPPEQSWSAEANVTNGERAQVRRNRCSDLQVVFMHRWKAACADMGITQNADDPMILMRFFGGVGDVYRHTNMTDQHFRRVYLGIERILRKHLEQLRYFIFVTEAKDPEWNGTLEKFSAVEPNIPFHGQRITPDDISAIYEVHFPFVEDKESKQAIGVRIFFGPESSPSGSAVKEIYDRKLTP